jgi:hypothetical protein
VNEACHHQPGGAAEKAYGQHRPDADPRHQSRAQAHPGTDPYAEWEPQEACLQRGVTEHLLHVPGQQDHVADERRVKGTRSRRSTLLGCDW